MKFTQSIELYLLLWYNITKEIIIGGRTYVRIFRRYARGLCLAASSLS